MAGSFDSQIKNAVAQRDIDALDELLRRQFTIGYGDDEGSAFIQFWGSQADEICASISAAVVQANDESFYRALAARFLGEINIANLPAPGNHTLYSYAKARNAGSIIKAIETPPTLALVFVGSSSSSNNSAYPPWQMPPRTIDLRASLMDGEEILGSFKTSIADNRLPPDYINRQARIAIKYCMETQDLFAAEQVINCIGIDARFTLSCLSDLQQIAVEHEQFEIANLIRTHSSSRVEAAQARSKWSAEP